MYVYELAIQLGKRSTDLTDAADQLGFGPLIAASELTAEQHAQLVHHFTGMVVTGPMPTSTLGSLGGSGPIDASGSPTLVAPAPPRSAGSKAGLIVGAVLAVVALLAGAYVLIGGQQDEFERQVDAQADAEARGVIPESEPSGEVGGADDPDAPAGAPVGAPATTAPPATEDAMCAAAQHIIDLDDGPSAAPASTFDAFLAKMDALEAALPELLAAYDDLAAAAPADLATDVRVMRDQTEAMSMALIAVEQEGQLESAYAAADQAVMAMADSAFRVDGAVDAACGVKLLD